MPPAFHSQRRLRLMHSVTVSLVVARSWPCERGLDDLSDVNRCAVAAARGLAKLRWPAVLR